MSIMCEVIAVGVFVAFVGKSFQLVIVVAVVMTAVYVKMSVAIVNAYVV